MQYDTQPTTLTQHDTSLSLSLSPSHSPSLLSLRAGGGAASSEVTTTTLDTIVGDKDVELLLVTCQGFEWQVTNCVDL